MRELVHLNKLTRYRDVDVLVKYRGSPFGRADMGSIESDEPIDGSTRLYAGTGCSHIRFLDVMFYHDKDHHVDGALVETVLDVVIGYTDAA